MSSREILEYISEAIDFIIYTERSHGVRRVTEIAEVQGMQGDVVTIAPTSASSTTRTTPSTPAGSSRPASASCAAISRRWRTEGVFVDDDWFNPQAVF